MTIFLSETLNYQIMFQNVFSHVSLYLYSALECQLRIVKFENTELTKSQKRLTIMIYNKCGGKGV